MVFIVNLLSLAKCLFYNSMHKLISAIDQLLQDRSLLNHPFYIQWSEGKLTQVALSGYAKEYYQLVKAVPTCVENIRLQAPENMQTALLANQAEEQEHIVLWENFAQFFGISKEALLSYEGLPKTQAAVRQFKSLSTSYLEGASAMYTFEKALPEISQTKLEGLKKFYNIDHKKATTYFEVHAVIDIIHAAYWSDMLSQESQHFSQPLLTKAEQSLDAQHLLLDSCLEAYC